MMIVLFTVIAQWKFCLPGFSIMKGVLCCCWSICFSVPKNVQVMVLVFLGDFCLSQVYTQWWQMGFFSDFFYALWWVLHSVVKGFSFSPVSLVSIWIHRFFFNHIGYSLLILVSGNYLVSLIVCFDMFSFLDHSLFYRTIR